MGQTNNLNVYAGEDSLRQYFDPDCQPPLPLVEIPACLNPYRKDGVRIYAKMMTVLPANNVKALPALNLLSKSVDAEKTKTVVEYSSGSTVISMALIGRVCHGITDTRAYLSNKTSDAKLKLMQFFGLNLTLFGGPSQPEPLDERGGIQAARRKAIDEESTVNPNQYENDANWQAHLKWTGPQILKQLPQISVLCAGMGTSGTMTGMGTYFKEAKPSVVRVGVCTAPGDRVPGPRSYALMSPVTFPWRNAIDTMEEVGSTEAYTLSLALSREGLICGPSSGFNLQGLYQFIEKRKAAGTLSDIADAAGEVHCVFLCCDLPYQYINEYFSKLDASQFHPITNHRLTAVDSYRYDEAWELSVSAAFDRFYTLLSPNNLTTEPPATPTPLPETTVLDLRQPADFASWHLPGARNVPLKSITRVSPSPFADAATLEAQWREMEKEVFCDTGAGSWPDVLRGDGCRVLLICYDGDSARVATSVLRAKGVCADSVRGGARAVAEWWPRVLAAAAAAAGVAAAAGPSGCGEPEKAAGASSVVRVVSVGSEGA